MGGYSNREDQTKPTARIQMTETQTRPEGRPQAQWKKLGGRVGRSGEKVVAKRDGLLSEMCSHWKHMSKGGPARGRKLNVTEGGVPSRCERTP